MHDPAYLSLLSNLGWKDDDDEHPNSSFNPPKENDNTNLLFTHSTSNISMKIPRRSKAEIQRELIGLKRKALTLRREGKTNEAEEVLTAAKSLEAEMEEMETPKKEIQIKPSRPKDKIIRPVRSAAEEGDMDDVTEKDMQDPSLISMLTSLGWKDDEDEAVTAQAKASKQASDSSVNSTNPSRIPFPSSISAARQRSKGEIQRELLGLKRKALALRRKGETEEAEEIVEDGQSAGVPNGRSGSEKFISAAVDPDEKVLESFVHSGSKESDTIGPLLRSPDIVNSVSFELNKGKHPSKIKSNFGSDTSSLPEHHVHVGSLRSHPVRSKNEEISSASDVSLSSDPHGHVHAPKNLGSKENARTKLSEETVNAEKKPHVDETDSVQGLVSQNNKSSLQQEVLAHKRKALALKREGKLAEAREELRQAKLLEKSLEVETPEPAGGTHDGSTSASNASSAQQKDHGAPNLAPKPLSGRDRFKVQQESLGHKRQALKMRREGRVEEAEAEFELAKALEARLDEMSSANVAEPVDDVVVEDLLDPQLLSALKAIGIQDTSIIPQGSERPGPVKVSPTQSESYSQERTQLEERIKAEKVKAVNLKRAGKQAEALDALRRSKMFEKKLNSLA
ncbi:hypothetical protein OIU78_024388 [Salix suchowensis]|nr:hypothetical protein OIU78_024388 [Salix suchowensis]